MGMQFKNTQSIMISVIIQSNLCYVRFQSIKYKCAFELYQLAEFKSLNMFSMRIQSDKC